jgi:hypothetical protein
LFTVQAGGIEILADILCEDEDAVRAEEEEEAALTSTHPSLLRSQNSNRRAPWLLQDDVDLDLIGNDLMPDASTASSAVPGLRKQGAAAGRNAAKKWERLAQERTEAAGVLAQVTSPWIEENHHLGGLNEHLRRIVTALTGKIPKEKRKIK